VPERIPPPPTPPTPRALQVVSVILLALWVGVTLGSRQVVGPVSVAVTAVEHLLGLDRAPGGES